MFSGAHRRIERRLAPLFALGLLALSCAPVFAQQPDSSPMRFVRYGMDEGLSQSAVNRMVQDRAGFIWVATENGLDRFDGYSFRSYRHDRADSRSLPNDFVTDLGLDAYGNLWIGTDGGGLARRVTGRHGFDVYSSNPGDPASLAGNHVRRVLADPRGWIWVGTMRHGLSRLDPRNGTFTHYRHDPGNPASLSDDRIYSLWLDDDGTLWVGTGAGVDRIDAATNTVERVMPNASWAGTPGDNRVLAILRDRNDALWVGTARDGLGRLDEETQRFRVYRHDETDPRSLAGDRIEALYEDTSGRLWVGTTDGLHLMDRRSGEFSRYAHEPSDASSLSDSYVVSMLEDRAGVLWVGTKTGGMSKWNSRSWAMGHVDKGNVTSFTHDDAGRLWVGTFGDGISVYDGTGSSPVQIRHDVDTPGSLSDDRVMALATGTDGSVWAGTMHGGLNRIDPADFSVSVYRHDPNDADSLPADGVMSLFVCADGLVWVGTYGGGLSRFGDDDEAFVVYSGDADYSASFRSPNVTAISEDETESIWVGTSSGGVGRLDAETEAWTHFDHDPGNEHSLSSQAVYAIHIDAAETVWVGTRAGLNRFVPASAEGEAARFVSITQKDGLANNTVYGIRSDAEGRLWLSTNYGISRYDPATGEVLNYHASDGLQGEEFNFGAHHLGPDGVLYFGGSNGFNAFDPGQLGSSSEAPLVALTGFSKMNRPVPTEIPYEALQRVDLGYTDDMVSFEFAALDFSDPGQNRYAYMLEGFDKEWVDAGNLRRATYTDLPGGKYVFRVSAANSDGVWNDRGISLSMYVQDPPWLTWWAYVAYAMLILGALFGIHVRQQRKLAREAEYSRRLESEVRDRTKELGERNKQLEQANDKLKIASLTDALTGLRNRRYLFEHISKDIDLVRRHYDSGAEVDRNNHIVFVMVDLDNFKPVNDSCGHVAGDRMLLQVRDALVSACRSSDVVIRWGGDEFLVVGREATDEDASALAERIRARIAQSVFAVGNGQIARTTCSIGFAAYPFIREQPDLVGWEQVMGIADVALFRAKQERNGWAGIHGVTWKESGEALFQALQQDSYAVEESGAVSIEQSLSLANSKTA